MQEAADAERRAAEAEAAKKKEAEQFRAKAKVVALDVAQVMGARHLRTNTCSRLIGADAQTKSRESARVQMIQHVFKMFDKDRSHRTRP